MKLIIREFQDSDSKIWTDLNTNSKHSTFLNSLDWIEFQQSYEKGITFFQFLIELDSKAIGIWFIKLAKRKFSHSAFSPGGPVLNLEGLSDTTQKFVWQEIKVFATNFCKNQTLNTFKIEPRIYKTSLKLFLDLGFKQALSMGSAKDTWETNIDMTPEALLASFSKDTRYYIRRGLKNGVSIKKVSDIEEVTKFCALMEETTSRKGFINYPPEYYKAQWQELNSKGLTDIYLAEKDGKAIAGALINYFKDSAYYAHGASTSDPKLQKLAAPYALHFKIMSDLALKGFKTYNWWGVIPDEVKVHSWKGISDFKKKFTGNYIQFVGPLEIYSNPFRYYIRRLVDLWVYRKDRYDKIPFF